ncbi:MAG TPA: hypothetical protein PLU38_01965 [Kiritimatiellia bacterium]|nr:hypothetical protein [Kiritimatiellia bacterium]HQQ90606.1 hypothetical protein [Kiritimatiellia bacterium]
MMTGTRKNAITVLIMVNGALLLGGCASFSNKIAQQDIPLEMLRTTATYDIIGEATGTATGGKLFGFISIGGEEKYGQLGNMILVSPVEKAAVYNAIESVPTADALLAPRFSSKRSNYLIYSEESVTVKGKAIRYNVSAK